ncbi:MAG TPA: coenzyme F420-0:L-glutamate ligase [Marmoricola sp.]|nr:coenzyme F420-0:L-glutamate ligase [Marmoricola sp.]
MTDLVPPPDRLELIPVAGIGEVTEGTDLAGLVARAGVADGDVALLTSKVVSKAEGRVTTGDRATAVAAETVRVVARRGSTAIVENHLGLVMAAAGVDASNVAPGRVVLLPLDPDATARSVREEVLRRTGHNVAVVVTDTAGRAWRNGQTDIAIGVAGLEPVASLAGRHDRFGNPLAVTAPAVADELAGAAELVAGKLGGRPLVLVRGLAGLVQPAGQHGPGARALVRERGEDMFGLGAREAVLAAVRRSDAASFGAPAPRTELLAALASCGWSAVADGDDVRVDAGDDETGATTRLVEAVAFAHGWRPSPDHEPAEGLRLERGIQ